MGSPRRIVGGFSRTMGLITPGEKNKKPSIAGRLRELQQACKHLEASKGGVSRRRRLLTLKQQHQQQRQHPQPADPNAPATPKPTPTAQPAHQDKPAQPPDPDQLPAVK